MLAKAQGSVLEVGVGTGLNLGKYRFADVTALPRAAQLPTAPAAPWRAAPRREPGLTRAPARRRTAGGWSRWSGST